MRRALLIAAALFGTALLSSGVGLAATETAYDPRAFAKAGKPTLVDVRASWCPVCAKQHPILSKLGGT